MKLTIVLAVLMGILVLACSSAAPAPAEPTQSPRPTPSLVNIPPGLTVDLVIDRIVDPTNIGGGFVSYEGPIESRELIWQSTSRLNTLFKKGAMSVGYRSVEYKYVVGEYPPGLVSVALIGPDHFEADDFFERSVLVLGAIGFTEKGARSLLEQMRLKVKSERRVYETYEEHVGGLMVSLLPYKLDDEGELTAGMIIVSPVGEPQSIMSNNSVVAQWSGKSIKNTETFNVTTQEWKISWNTRPGDYGDMNFQIYVYKSDGTPHGTFVVANVIGEDNDSSVMRGAGNYYLTINAGQPYEITVAEMP